MDLRTVPQEHPGGSGGLLALTKLAAYYRQTGWSVTLSQVRGMAPPAYIPGERHLASAVFYTNASANNKPRYEWYRCRPQWLTREIYRDFRADPPGNVRTWSKLLVNNHLVRGGPRGLTQAIQP